VSDAILNVRDLRAGYGGEDILRGVSLAVPRGRIVAVIGPNGSGKSTLLKAVYGLLAVRGGSVTLADGEGRATSLAGLRPNAITALGVNMVPQIANVFADLTVLENLEIGAMPIRRRFAEQSEKVFAALPLLRTMLGRRAAVLSGGQRQMLAFGRALMSDPKLLILDEPSAGLAPMVQEEVFAKVTAVNRLGVSILMVEQKARQCLAFADYAYVLEQGRNRLDGAAADLLANPTVVRLYLGARRGTADPEDDREDGA
jgi:ABC-type branched-subunit amino acid transport system ATPase component